MQTYENMFLHANDVANGIREYAFKLAIDIPRSGTVINNEVSTCDDY